MNESRLQEMSPVNKVINEKNLVPDCKTFAYRKGKNTESTRNNNLKGKKTLQLRNKTTSKINLKMLD